MLESLQKYLRIFERLRIDKSHGIAPHKPILLITILQAFQNNLITTPRIYIMPELVALFQSNWNLLVVTKHNCRISYPFYYLKSDKFWKLIPKTGFDNIEQIGSLVKSFSNLNAAVDFALIEDELFCLMKDKINNSILQQFLLNIYFPDTKSNFRNSTLIQQKMFDEIEGKILNEDAAEYKMEIQKLIQEQNEEEIFLRGSLFKREIPKIYNNTCCISGMRINSTLNVSLVDACHIIPFSESYNDTITNGIALCPNLHRAFDRGLIAIDSDYKVLVSTTFTEVESEYRIHIFEGKEIMLPRFKDYFPLKENFSWHKINIFKV